MNMMNGLESKLRVRENAENWKCGIVYNVKAKLQFDDMFKSSS